MSNTEQQTGKTVTAKSNTPSVDQVNLENSPGKILASARESLGLSQQQVADRLHLRVGSVQAVEQDALEPGVSVTFSKGYVRLYAKLVHLEVEPLLQAYDKAHIQEKQPAKLQSFSRRVTREANDHRWNMVTIVVVLLVIGSVIAWWVQRPDAKDDSTSFVSDTFDSIFNEDELAPESGTSNSDDPEELDPQAMLDPSEDDSALQNIGPAIKDNEASEIAESVSATAESAEATVDSFENQFTETANESAEAVESAVDELGANSNEVTNSMQDSVNNAAAVAQAYIANAEGYQVKEDGTVDLVFTFSDDCWVSVKDVNEEVMAVGVKAKGRVMQVSGLPPITVILGAPQHVSINLGGKDVDMSVYPGDRSAKFQLSVES